ncbi:hypothetical protein GQ600_22779 [Phytophthora cactorum]|nr:hypothetical protein GQ600_22779 [Phytophthora cactorum]
MLYAVNLAVGLSTTSDDPATFQQLRTLVHDIQWGGPEPDALFQIRFVDQLHHCAQRLWAAVPKGPPVRRPPAGLFTPISCQLTPKQLDRDTYGYTSLDPTRERHPGVHPFPGHSRLFIPKCRHAYALHQLPPAVLQWISSHHGALKEGRPQHA